MNNITFGGAGFAYYETLGGGAGAGISFKGESGVHTNMTNSLNTPIEALEIDFPVEMVNYCLRKGSGGKGKFNGGEGLCRSYKFLQDAHVSILSERRRSRPYGLAGGGPGKTGENILLKSIDNTGKRRKIRLGSKLNIEIKAGDVLSIKTPGGGGYGKKE
jgi:N-methylhydantoinase B/oxoprolinase/acetone carboxylase alpha subunit